MKFWDSSAIIPLIAPESESKIIRSLHQKDPEMLVWALTLTEIYSSLYRKVREGKLGEADFSEIEERLKFLERGWSEVIQIESTRKRANRLLATHSLRAADALQLAAALIVYDDRTEGEGFVTLDKNLALAAKKEGFLIFP